MLRSMLALTASAILLASAGGASSAILIYDATLSGANEIPPTGSPATGSAQITIDDVANTMLVTETFSGLIGGPAGAAHIHCCIPVGMSTGIAVGFPGFPAATSGAYTNTFDLTNAAIYTAGFLAASGGTAAGAENALLTGLAAGQAYANIHDAAFVGGEIRGQFAPPATTSTAPEPAAWALALIGLGLTGAALRRQPQRRPASA